MKFFARSVQALPVGFDIFISRKRIVRILQENFPDLLLTNESDGEMVIELFEKVCKELGCTIYPYIEDDIEGFIVRKDEKI